VVKSPDGKYGTIGNSDIAIIEMDIEPEPEMGRDVKTGSGDREKLGSQRFVDNAILRENWDDD
jgi:hypothetical protein